MARCVGASPREAALGTRALGGRIPGRAPPRPGSGPRGAYPRGAQVLWLGGQVLWHLAAARGQVEDGRGGHVRRLHVVRVVEAALAARAAGAAAAAAAQVAAAAGRVAAGGAAARAGVLAVPLRWGDTGTGMTWVPAAGGRQSGARRPATRPAALPPARGTHVSGERGGRRGPTAAWWGKAPLTLGSWGCRAASLWQPTRGGGYHPTHLKETPG